MKPGEKITIIFRHGVVLTETREPRANELSLSPSEQTIWTYIAGTEASLQARVRFDEEGVTWLRGHHLPDSKEVAGLRVAQALSVKSEPQRKPPQRVGGFGSSFVASTIGVIAAELIHKMIEKEKK